MRGVLALLGYVALVAGGLALLVLGGLWAGARFLGDGPSGKKPRPGRPAASAPRVPGQGAEGEPAAPTMEQRIQEIAAEISPAQLVLEVVGADGQPRRGVRVSIVPQDVPGEVLQLFLHLSRQAFAPVPPGLDVAVDGQGRRPARPLAERGPDRSVVPAGHPLEVVAWSPRGEAARVVLPALEAGARVEHRLVLREPGAPAPTATPSPGEAGGLDPDARLDRFLSVRDARGRPVREARALADRRGAASPMAGGLLRLRLRPDLGGWVQVGAPGHGSLVLRGGELGMRPDEPWVIELPPAAALEVLVREAGGEVVPGLTVRVLMVPGDEQPGRAPTGVPPLAELESTREAIRAGELPAGVPLRVEVVQGRQLVLRPEEPLVLEPGEVRPLELELPSADLTRGRLLDPSGEPVADVDLWLQPAGGDPRRARYLEVDEKPARRASTGLDGGFRLTSLEPGRWWIGVAPPEVDRDRERPVTIQDVRWAPLASSFQIPEDVAQGPDEDLLELTAVPARTLEGTVILSPLGNEPESPGVGLVVVASSVEYGSTFRTIVGRSGRFTLMGLAPGHFSIDVEGEEPGAGVRVEGGNWHAAGETGLRIYVERTGEDR